MKFTPKKINSTMGWMSVGLEVTYLKDFSPNFDEIILMLIRVVWINGLRNPSLTHLH